MSIRHRFSSALQVVLVKTFSFRSVLSTGVITKLRDPIRLCRRPYLAAWLDILQTLRAHLPGLVDRLLAAPTGGFQLDSRARAVSREGLSLLLRRPWDPAATGLTRRRLARLPGNPVLVVAPPGPADPKLVSRRMRLWNNQLGCLGKVIVINMPPPRGEAGNRTPVGNYLYQVIVSFVGSSIGIYFFLPDGVRHTDKSARDQARSRRSASGVTWLGCRCCHCCACCRLGKACWAGKLFFGVFEHCVC